jgi:hypothetical protein
VQCGQMAWGARSPKGSRVLRWLSSPTRARRYHALAAPPWNPLATPATIECQV